MKSVRPLAVVRGLFTLATGLLADPAPAAAGPCFDICMSRCNLAAGRGSCRNKCTNRCQGRGRRGALDLNPLGAEAILAGGPPWSLPVSPTLLAAAS